MRTVTSYPRDWIKKSDVKPSGSSASNWLFAPGAPRARSAAYKVYVEDRERENTQKSTSSSFPMPKNGPSNRQISCTDRKGMPSACGAYWPGHEVHSSRAEIVSNDGHSDECGASNLVTYPASKEGGGVHVNGACDFSEYRKNKDWGCEKLDR